MKVTYADLAAMIDVITDSYDAYTVEELCDYLSANETGFFVIEEGDSDD